jgi:hypothetical protein
VDYYLAFNKRWYISPAYELDNWKTAEKFLKNEEAKTSRS